MNPKIIAFILPCIIGIPMLVMNLGAIGLWASHEQSMGQEPTVPGPVANVGMFVTTAWQANNERTEREVLFDAAALTTKRTVEFSRPVTIEDVMPPGETLPRVGFHHLYILARAPMYAMDECNLILQELGTSCTVGRTHVDHRKDGSYLLRTNYVYLPDQPMGDTSKMMRAHLAIKRVDLTPNIRNSHVAKADLPALRLETYSAAMRACTELRIQTGSCSISKIDFSQSEDADRPGFYKVSAKANLGWLKVGFDSDTIELDEDSLVDRVSGYFSAKPEEETVQTAEATQPVADAEPKILRGGNAFRSAGSARFVKAPGD